MAARLSQSPCMNCEYGEAPECTGYALLSEQEEMNLAQYRKARGSPGGLSQILCKHRNAVQIEQNIFKVEVVQAAAALFSK